MAHWTVNGAAHPMSWTKAAAILESQAQPHSQAFDDACSSESSIINNTAFGVLDWLKPTLCIRSCSLRTRDVSTLVLPGGGAENI